MIHNLTKADYAEVSNGTTEVVTAVQNTKGIIVYHAFINNGTTTTGSVNIGGKAVLDHDINDSSQILPNPLMFAKGQNLEIISGAGASKTAVWYEVLS